jgi:hypothetical protein
MIDMDRNRKTFRSNIKSRNGKRLPGMEVYYQGLELSEGDITRATLPILARGGLGIQHEYSSSTAVYKSVNNSSTAGLEKIIDLFIKIGTGATFADGSSEVDFTNLVGQSFTINNPEYKKDPSVVSKFRFEFTALVGIDPRLLYQENGMYTGDSGRRGDAFNANMKDHLLRPYPRVDRNHEEFETKFAVELAEYGKLDTGKYLIPVGFPTSPFPGDQYPNNINGSSKIDPDNFDLTDVSVYTRLAANPYWLYAVITRAFYNALPPYFEILDPDTVPQYPNVSKASGAISLWDQFSMDNSAPSTPLRIKLRYKPNTPAANFSASNSVSSAADISIDPWDFTRDYEWARVGYKAIEKDRNIFYEDFRTDFLKQTEIRPLDGDVASINLYTPQTSVGTTTPSFIAGSDIVKYEEVLSNTTAYASSAQLVSEHMQIRKSQKRDALINTYATEFTYFEDVHYVDPDQQTHSNLREQWVQWVDVNDHGGDEELAKLQHLINVFDYRYSPMRLHPEAPMSGRIDIFNRVRSFYENMPEAVLSNTKRTISAQSFDLKSTTITVDTWLKKSEEIDLKKFEDVNGKRNEGNYEYHVIENIGTSLITLNGNTLPLGIYRSYDWGWEDSNLTTFSAKIKYRDETIESSWSSLATPSTYPALGKTTQDDAVYAGYVATQSPGPSIMFNDYFDQQEPDVLDYIEEERWTRIDDEMMVWLTQRYWDHDNNAATTEEETGRSVEIDRREYQQSDYLYANTGHTTVHYQRVNGIIAQEHKR